MCALAAWRIFAAAGHWRPNGTEDDPNDDFWVDGDYHLKSQAGRWDPGSDSWVMDDVTSPCIDTGDPDSPIGYEPMPNGGTINMGVYGGTLQASASQGDANSISTIHQASDPMPGDGSINVELDTTLTWTAGLDAVSHEVYFGTDNLPPFVSKTPDAVFIVGTLLRDTTYWWRVDEIDDQGGRTIGDIWMFMISPSPQASNPSPADGARGVGLDTPGEVALSWTPGYSAQKHDVYLGTDPNNVNAATPTYNPDGAYKGRYDTNDCSVGDLLRGKTYYWRVDEIDEQGRETTGDLWTFSTQSPPGPKGRTCFTGKTLVWIDIGAGCGCCER